MPTITAPDTATSTRRLWGWCEADFSNRPDPWHDTPERVAAAREENRQTTLAAAFGQLVKLAAPVIELYHGDLYRDAQWLNERVHGPFTFWWQVHDCGTTIDTVGGDVRRACEQVNPHRGAYLMDLTNERGCWHLAITPLAPPAAATGCAA